MGNWVCDKIGYNIYIFSLKKKILEVVNLEEVEVVIDGDNLSIYIYLYYKIT